MRSFVVKSILSTMVLAMFAACAKKSDTASTPVRKANTAPQEAPKNVPAPNADEARKADEQRRKEQQQPTVPGSNNPTQPNQGQGPSLPGSGQQQQPPSAPGTGQNDFSKPGAQDEPHKKQKPPVEIEPPQMPEGQTQPAPVLPTPEQQETFASQYTTAGDDYLQPFLKQRASQNVSAAEHQRDVDFAQSIHGVRAQVDRGSRDAQISVVITSGGVERTVLLSGTLDHGERPLAHLRAARDRSIRGHLICLDLNRTSCFTSLITLEQSGHGQVSTAQIISRRSNANIHLTLPETQTGERSFAKVVDLFNNTVLKNGSPNSLRTISFDTFEVINGKSAVKLAFFSHENEVIVASGPLLVGFDGGKLTNVRMSRNLDIQSLVDFQAGRNFRTSLHNSISSIRMIGNSGGKELNLAMNVGAEVDANKINVSLVRFGCEIILPQQLESLLRHAEASAPARHVRPGQGYHVPQLEMLTEPQEQKSDLAPAKSDKPAAPQPTKPAAAPATPQDPAAEKKSATPVGPVMPGQQKSMPAPATASDLNEPVDV